MTFDIKFECITCWWRWKESKQPLGRDWIRHEWEGEGSFSDAVKHQQENPDHRIRASVEVTL